MMFVKRWLWSLHRQLGLSPTQKVFRELQRRGIPLGQLDALEAFGGTGDLQTRDYAGLVGQLELWEIVPEYVAALRRSFPNAKILETDCYKQVEAATKQYDLITVENPEGEHGGHHEHFDFFPAVLRLAKDSAVLIINVRPGAGLDPVDPRERFDEAQLARRRAFYRTDHPERMALEEMVPTYKELLQAAGFDLEWYFFQKRTISGRIHYLVMKLKRTGPAH